MITTTPFNKSAVLIMDYQNIILEGFIPTTEATKVINNTATLLNAARNASIPVFYVKVGFASGYPEVNANNAVFSGIKSAGLFLINDARTDIHAALKPLAEDPVIIKHRVGAFTATSLDMQLRAKGIETLVLAGVTTSGVVLSSVRQALDLDYRLVVATDCCTDTSPAKHEIIMNEVIADHCAIMTASDIASHFSSLV